jgi:hypothetical protein
MLICYQWSNMLLARCFEEEEEEEEQELVLSVDCLNADCFDRNGATVRVFLHAGV